MNIEWFAKQGDENKELYRTKMSKKFKDLLNNMSLSDLSECATVFEASQNEHNKLFYDSICRRISSLITCSIQMQDPCTQWEEDEKGYDSESERIRLALEMEDRLSISDKHANA